MLPANPTREWVPNGLNRTNFCELPRSSSHTTTNAGTGRDTRTGYEEIFIPIEARVLAIADAFDAIQIPGVIDQDARDRAAYRILTVGAGTQFDPHLVEMFGHCLQRPNLTF